MTSGDPGPWLLLLLSPLGVLVPGAVIHAGHSRLFLGLVFGAMAALHGAMLLSWRARQASIAALLEPIVPFATLLILTMMITSSGVRWPLLWIAVYLYAPILAHLYERSGWFLIGLFGTGAFIAAVEFSFPISDTPDRTLVANALLPPILYLLLSAEPERERRAHAEIAAHAERLERARAEEHRLNLARDVHDGIGAHLTAAAMQAEVAANALAHQPERARASLSRLRLRLQQAVDELTFITGEPTATTWRALGQELGQVAESVATPCDLQHEVRLAEPDRPVPPAASQAFRRIIQEGIANAIRHGRARHIQLELSVDDAQARLSISDDGVGLSNAPEGFGRRGIAARMLAVGGEARWESRPQGGTKLQLILPLRPVPGRQVNA